jgi:hypothetical protein
VGEEVMATNKGAKPSKPNKPKPSATVAKKANQTRNKGKGGQKFGAVGGYGGVDQNMVQQLINQTVRPELKSMRDDRQYVNRQADRAVGDANSLYNRSVGDLNYVYGEAGDYINSLGSKIGAGYDQTQQNVAGMDATAASQMQASTSAVQQAIQSQLGALGLGGAIGGQSALQGDAAFAQAQQAQQAGNNQANLEMQQQSAATLTSLLGGMIQGSRASNMGQAANTRQTGITDVNRAKQDDLSTINESMQTLKASKPGMIREMLLQLQAQGFDQWQAIQSLNMSRRQMKHGFAMDRAGMAEDSAYYGTAAQSWGSQAGAGVGSPTSSSGINSSNPSWIPNNPSSGSGPKPPKKGPKGGPKKGPRGGYSSNHVDSVYGPQAGNY